VAGNASYLDAAPRLVDAEIPSPPSRSLFLGGIMNGGEIRLWRGSLAGIMFR
jgi:hypothetical protein